MLPDRCARCGCCPVCGLTHEAPICAVSGDDADEQHHPLGWHLDPDIAYPRSQAAHDAISERQRLSGIPLRAEGRMRHIAAARHGVHELHELLAAVQAHYERGLEGGA
jgi:hypothetical protein